MPSIAIHALGLKGPAGNAAPAQKRVVVSQLGLVGPTDKRVVVSALSLEAPPPEKKVAVSQINLVGPTSASRPVYRGGTTGWQPVRVYIGSGGNWVEIPF